MKILFQTLMLHFFYLYLFISQMSEKNITCNSKRKLKTLVMKNIKDGIYSFKFICLFVYLISDDSIFLMS